ncbi:MAG: hypothetical protein GDA38_07345 [Hormoscilla sp. SP12CHS1]|nr:hypothetical protein [Hormoscilla sp. SP12CHS1]
MNALHQVRETILNWIIADEEEAYTWKGHAVRLLDGTTFRLQPTAIKAGTKPNKLSFSCCWRRVRDIWLQGVPQWVITENKLEDWLMTRLAKCRLSHQQNKVKHEPRKVRRRSQVFPALKDSRDLARKQVLQELQSESVN